MLAIFTLSTIILLIFVWVCYNTILENNEKAKKSVYFSDISKIDQHGKAMFYNVERHCYTYRKPTFWEKRFLKH